MTALKRNIFVQLFEWIIIPFYTVLCSFWWIKKTRLNKSRLFMHWQLFYQCKMAFLHKIAVIFLLKTREHRVFICSRVRACAHIIIYCIETNLFIEYWNHNFAIIFIVIDSVRTKVFNKFKYFFTISSYTFI